MDHREKYNILQILKFVVPSILGVLFLMFPFKYNGDTTIAVALLASKLVDISGDILPLLILIFITCTALLTVLFKAFGLKIIEKNNFLRGIANVSNLWMIIRIMGLIFAYCAYFKMGPEFIYSEDTGSLILFDLLVTLFTMFLFAGFLLPLLTDFGLLEYVGALLTPVMRPFFGLPGRSSIDCIASWVGDGTIGVALTNKQYELGYYTAKEAAVIATTFSAVSITFCLVVLKTVDLVYLFGPYYLTVVASGIVAALILPRIPPLSKKKNTYYKGVKKDLGENIPKGYNTGQWGLKLAVEKAEDSFNLSKFIKNGTSTVFDMWFGVLPSIMAFGTLGLIIAEYTSVFEILGKPFIPIYNFFNVEYAVEASKTVMVGFADMFIPSVIGATIPSEMTRFIVATLSVTQLVYLSEAGSVILGSKIDIGFVDLFIIYVERTLVTLPVIIAVAHLLF
ncbi:YjiH family protein [Anaerosphaera multitolerans]|uniref:YjiH family protein n=1 Tax=Anaerosphaera multitolerans TaxID=2487351 RepID=A0A437S6D5_9FIRM|nr:YjiH family protein [Anaerosphaera multitolerans]RVU54563.1 YjiH family protein [Anaerosphaera multitolerans]